MVFRECVKENLKYKMAALDCFGTVVEEYSADRFKDIADLLFPILDPVRSVHSISFLHAEFLHLVFNMRIYR